jgi:glycosyltransferase involved in cell wall biosynthesis
MTRPRLDVSVVVPSYNGARTIAATLDALLAQTHPLREIVVVDDGSKDQTREALAPYTDRVRAIHQVNSGVSAARNRGVAETSGEWLAFCDADDLWDPDKIAVMAAVVASRPDADVIFHEYGILIDDRIVEARGTHSSQTLFPIFRETALHMRDILPDHRVVDVAGVAEPWRRVETWFGEPFTSLMIGNFVLPSTLMIRRRAFDAIAGFDGAFRFAEDTEFFLRLAKVRPFLWVDAPLTAYRRAAGTLLTGNMLPTIRNSTLAVVKHCVDDAAVYRAHRPHVRRAVGRRYARLAYFCLSDLRQREALGYALRAIGMRPMQTLAWGVALASLTPPPLLRWARARKSRARAGGA